ncbi:hypothetical protein ACA910_005282 [Epithemia clementina (nom. ined.)]
MGSKSTSLVALAISRRVDLRASLSCLFPVADTLCYCLGKFDLSVTPHKMPSLHMATSPQYPKGAFGALAAARWSQSSSWA